MLRVRSVFARARELVHRRRIAAELDAELRFHLEQEIEYNVARGMSAADARRAATVSFGGVERYRADATEARGFIALDNLARDIRLAVRRLRRAPAFTAGVVATLAVGIGSAVGVAALVYGVMLRPLRYSDPESLVRVSATTPGLGTTTTELSSGMALFFRERSRTLAAVGAYSETDGVTITEGEHPERVTSALLTRNVFDILRARPAVGRLFRDEDAVGSAVPVLISYGLWMRRFGGDSSIVGRSIELNRSPRVVLGVLPEDFDFPSPSTSVWYPTSIAATRAGLDSRYLTVIGRLRPGATVSEADAELRALAPHLSDRFPELTANALRQSGFTPGVRPLREAMIAPVRPELLLLGAMVVVILVIATTNVATLFLLRAERLRGEGAVSRALGASRGALTQRFVVEGLVVSLAGGVAALPLVGLAVATKFGFTAAQVPRLHEVELSAGVVIALFAAVTTIGVILGLAAVARIDGGSPADTLRQTARSTGRGTRAWRRTQQSLVGVQIALALALLLGAALMGESLARLRRVDIGFSARGNPAFETVLPYTGYSRYQLSADFHLRVLESLRGVPGVADAAAAMHLPLTAAELGMNERLEARVDGTSPRQAAVTANMVSSNYFSLMGIPVRAGRSFARGDAAGAQPGVIVSTSLARELFGRADPVGREVRIAESTRYPAYRVVGVVGDVYGERIPDGPVRELYFPLLDDVAPGSLDTLRLPYNPGLMRYVLRADAPAPSLLPAIQRAVRSIDSRVPVARVTTLDAIVSNATARTRLTMTLLAIAAAAALLLGAIGVYSVIAYAVAGRGSEFGVRLALGATPPKIMGLVFREGAAVAAFGVAAGVGLSLVGTRFLRGVLYEVSATNPVAYAAAATALCCVAVAAMYLPARRAARTDPASALRSS